MLQTILVFAAVTLSLIYLIRHSIKVIQSKKQSSCSGCSSNQSQDIESLRK